MNAKATSFIIMLLAAISSVQADEITITVDPTAQGCEDNSLSVVCESLDSAISFAASLSLSTSNVSQISTASVSINLQNGTHYITNQTYFGNTSVSFIGVDTEVSIVCVYNKRDDTNDSFSIHTWYFDKSKAVRMDNLQFWNCSFPFRMFVVEQVSITNCSFM